MGILNLLQSYLANKSALLSELNTSNAIGSTNLRWTANSWNTFVAARTSAQNVYNDVGASQIQADNAMNALCNARTGLAIQSISLSFTGSWTNGSGAWGSRAGYAILYSSGTLTLNGRTNNMTIHAVAGGGGGGWGNGGGGGGGGIAYRASGTYNAGSYWVQVGGGGGKAPGGNDNVGGNGGNSNIFDIQGNGGGGGACWTANGAWGGSGGGGGGGDWRSGGGPNQGAPSGGLGYGNWGGSGHNDWTGGGGGGATGPADVRYPGAGLYIPLTGGTYAGGGGGGGDAPTAGIAGGGNGGGTGGDGLSNTGGGGGGGGSGTYGGNGGSGIIIIQWAE